MFQTRESRQLLLRLLIVTCLVGLGLLGAAGCGSGGKGTAISNGTATSASVSTGAEESEIEPTITTSRVPPGQRFRGDGDADNPADIDGNGDVDPGKDKDNDYPTQASYKFPDADDRANFDFGHEPSAREAHTISAIVKRYYIAGSAGNGAAACALLLPNFARTVPESYGGQAGPPYLRGAKTCAAVVSKLFAYLHEELSEAITIVGVRVEGRETQVLLASRKMRASHIFLLREGGSWRIEGLVGQPLP